MSDLQVRRQLDQQPAFVDEGVCRVDAEHEWVVTGGLGAIEEIQRSLPEALVRRVGDALLVSFGNSVGQFDVSGVLCFDVHTGKWSGADFEGMLADVVRVSASLPFASGEGGALSYDRDLLRREDVLYHSFVYLRHALQNQGDGNLIEALRCIHANPHRRLRRVERNVPLALASRVEPKAALRALEGELVSIDEEDRARTSIGRSGERLARSLDGQLPTSVNEQIARATVDVPENRFVKAFLDMALALVDELRQRSRNKAGQRFSEAIAAQCTSVERALVPLRRHALWSDVGRLQRMPTSSTILQRRRGYRDVLRHFIGLRASTRLLLDEAEARRLLELKDVATLYELWCYYQVVDVLRTVMGEEPEETDELESSTWQTTLQRGARLVWSNGTSVTYNEGFSRSRPLERRSYSLGLRPDITLQIPAGPCAGLHFFDAKFRLQRSTAARELEDEGLRGFKSADVHKMHAYRDALQGARTAWTLYPGDRFTFFGVDATRVSTASELSTDLDGVGAIPLGPGRQSSLIETVRWLLQPSSDTRA